MQNTVIFDVNIQNKDKFIVRKIIINTTKRVNNGYVSLDDEQINMKFSDIYKKLI